MRKFVNIAILIVTSIYLGSNLHATSNNVRASNLTPDCTKKSFSIGPSKKVLFSPGNLQYHPTNNEWRFAENQTDYVAGTYIVIGGWWDLFGWGTGSNPRESSTNNDDYQVFVDWGINRIASDTLNTWRTLTYTEWEYLLMKRSNHANLYAVACVAGVNGLILLPDDWMCPSEITFRFGCNNFGTGSYSSYQKFTANEWSKLESSGAVFLPAAGSCDESDAYYVQEIGFYWTATSGIEKNFAPCFEFSSDQIRMFNDNSRARGFSVRLVKDI